MTRMTRLRCRRKCVKLILINEKKVHILVSQYVALFGNYGKHSSLSILSKIDAHKQYNHVYCNEIHL